MKLESLYSQALVLLGETADSTAVSDYSSRADYLIPGVLAELASASEALGTPAEIPEAPAEKSADFPLDSRLTAPAAALLASTLRRDESAGLASELDAHASRLLRFCCPPDVGHTREVYQ